MKNLKLLLLIVCLVFPCSPFFAKADGKILIYYFKNLTGSADYDDLIYAVPLCIYNQLQATNNERNYSVVDQAAFDAYLKDTKLDLWDSDYMRNNARKKKFDRILFGFFYDEGQKLQVRGKIYYTESGLILDIPEDDEDFSPLFQAVERADVTEVRSCGTLEDVKTYKIPARLIDDEQSSQSKQVFNFSGSAVFPVSDWRELYPIGFYGNFSYIIFPKRNRVRLGFGPEVGTIFMGRGEDDFISSTLLIVPVGGSIQYVLIGKNMSDRLVASFSAGLSVSILKINNQSEESIDFFSKGGLSFIVKIAKRAELSFSAGLLSVSFSDTPLNAVYGELGFRSFIF
jgi:hypothetical protein